MTSQKKVAVDPAIIDIKSASDHYYNGDDDYYARTIRTGNYDGSIPKPKSQMDMKRGSIREQAKENICNYIDEQPRVEYQKCLTGITAIMKEA